jgi:outer membrane protein assembly factor BamB
MRTLLHPVSALLLSLMVPPLCAADWPAWRGPKGTGVTEETGLPVKWSKTENVKWRVELPEAGNSTPIVAKGRVFVTQAVKDQRTLMCFDRKDGKLLWQKGVTTKEKEPTHGTNPYCSATPVTDGERVIASFASDGLYCYDFEGKELWRRDDLGRQIHIWGNGSSPVIHGDLCFLNFGPGETTYLLAVEKKTGKTVWKVDVETGYGKQPPVSDSGKAGNPTFIGSWTTPVLMPVGGKTQLIMAWPGRVAAYEPETGKELWTCQGLNALVYTDPLYRGELVVAMGGFNGKALAVKAGGTGDVTDSHRVWLNSKSPQRIGSGVIRGEHIYIHNDPGMAQCIALETGETVWQERLKGASATGQNWSSVTLSGDLCYTISQGGDCFVFKADPKFELVRVNSLGERSNSTIVPCDGELFIRTHRALWCIGQ